MSDKLAISAAFSVLMMTAYVLFGNQAAHVPFDAQAIRAPAAVSAPAFEIKALLR